MLPVFHSITRSDSNSSFSDIGKKNAFSVLKDRYHKCIGLQQACNQVLSLPSPVDNRWKLIKRQVYLITETTANTDPDFMYELVGCKCI